MFLNEFNVLQGRNVFGVNCSQRNNLEVRRVLRLRRKIKTIYRPYYYNVHTIKRLG